jgi:hypothetical protein
MSYSDITDNNQNQPMKLTSLNPAIGAPNPGRASLIKQRPCSRNRHLWFFQVINEMPGPRYAIYHDAYPVETDRPHFQLTLGIYP